jgi:hypothetical protein
MTEGRDFGKPRLTPAQRQAILQRASSKWLPKTRFIANSVPLSVLRWLLAHEESVRDSKPRPPMPEDVVAWFRGRDIAFGAGTDAGEMRERGVGGTAGPAQLSHTCITCGTSFEAKRRDAQYCSTRCQVAAYRAGGTAEAAK